MWTMAGLKDIGPSIKPHEGEMVRDYFTRVMVEMKSMNVCTAYLRQCECFYEVKTDTGHTEEMEEWVFENAQDGAYYCTNIFGGPCSWFFNDKETAAIFKLAYGN
jgi:hypothetical protein